MSVLVDFGEIHCLLRFTLLDAPCPCILGMPFLHRTNPTINWEQRTVTFGKVSVASPTTANTFEPLPRDELLCDSGKECFTAVDENVFDH